MENSSIQETAESLRQELACLAASLRPFPAFWGMITIQAIELDPPEGVCPDRGCVVVTPEGEICQLNLTGISGVAGMTDQDHVEEFLALDLPPGEYAAYAQAAIAALQAELSRRG